MTLVIALNSEIGVPEWVELLPAGSSIRGRDGRTWSNSNPSAIVEVFQHNGADLPVDIEHSTEHKGPYGDPAPAVGWIKAMEVRGGAVWDRMEWTERGRNLLQNQEYRYLSPVFLYTKDEARLILRLTSAGLTNQPNLHLTALNRAITNPSTNPKEADMALNKAICQALGLGDETTEDRAVATITSLKGDLATARNQADNPTLEKFVPRSDFDAAINRASQAETKLKEHEDKALEAGIETTINQALESGKITPASADYHKAQCRTEGGLDRLKAYVEAAPVVAGDSGLEGQKPQSDSALSDEEKATCRMLGLSETDYLNTRKEADQ